jgi:hypothetical protein
MENLLGEGILKSFLSFGSGVLSLIIVYYVTTSVSKVMREVGVYEIEKLGHKVWQVNLIGYFFPILNPVFLLFEFIGQWDGILLLESVLSIIFVIVAQILYILFLHESYRAIGA